MKGQTYVKSEIEISFNEKTYSILCAAVRTEFGVSSEAPPMNVSVLPFLNRRHVFGHSPKMAVSISSLMLSSLQQTSVVS